MMKDFLGLSNYSMKIKAKFNNIKLSMTPSQQIIHWIIFSPPPSLFFGFTRTNKNHSFIDQLKGNKNHLVRMAPISSIIHQIIISLLINTDTQFSLTLLQLHAIILAPMHVTKYLPAIIETLTTIIT